MYGACFIVIITTSYIFGEISKTINETKECFVELVLFNENIGYKMKKHSLLV